MSSSDYMTAIEIKEAVMKTIQSFLPDKMRDDLNKLSIFKTMIIVDDSQACYNKYKVQTEAEVGQENIYWAYSEYQDLKIGDYVNVYIPEGNYDNDLQIFGKNIGKKRITAPISTEITKSLGDFIPAMMAEKISDIFMDVNTRNKDEVEKSESQNLYFVNDYNKIYNFEKAQLSLNLTANLRGNNQRVISGEYGLKLYFVYFNTAYGVGISDQYWNLEQYPPVDSVLWREKEVFEKYEDYAYVWRAALLPPSQLTQKNIDDIIASSWEGPEGLPEAGEGEFYFSTDGRFMIQVVTLNFKDMKTSRYNLLKSNVIQDIELSYEVDPSKRSKPKYESGTESPWQMTTADPSHHFVLIQANIQAYQNNNFVTDEYQLEKQTNSYQLKPYKKELGEVIDLNFRNFSIFFGYSLPENREQDVLKVSCPKPRNTLVYHYKSDGTNQPVDQQVYNLHWLHQDWLGNYKCYLTYQDSNKEAGFNSSLIRRFRRIDDSKINSEEQMWGSEVEEQDNNGFSKTFYLSKQVGAVGNIGNDSPEYYRNGQFSGVESIFEYQFLGQDIRVISPKVYFYPFYYKKNEGGIEIDMLYERGKGDQTHQRPIFNDGQSNQKININEIDSESLKEEIKIQLNKEYKILLNGKQYLIKFLN